MARPYFVCGITQRIAMLVSDVMATDDVFRGRSLRAGNVPRGESAYPEAG